MELGRLPRSQFCKSLPSHLRADRVIAHPLLDFAVELAPKVRVNAVLPGPVLLPDRLSADERNRAIAGTLLQRPGRPENVAEAVAFLLANDFVTGVSLPVDGGRTVAGSD